MIKGVGIDIIEVDRIKNIVLKNDRFLEKVFTKLEISYIESRNKNSNTISGLFAAKEAISKALGTGIRGFAWTDIEITHDELGKPIANLKGKAKEILNSQKVSNLSISISHNKENAIAIAILE